MTTIYNELKRRDLIENEKEYNDLIWLKQISVNNKIIESSKIEIDIKDIKKIKIGLNEFSV